MTNIYDVLTALAVAVPLLAAAATLAYAHVYADRKKLSTVLGELADAQRQLADATAALAEVRRDVDKIIERRM